MTVGKRQLSGVVAAVGYALILACTNLPGTTAGRQEPSPPREPTQKGSTPPVAATPAQAERLRRVMPPLLAVMDHPLPAER